MHASYSGCVGVGEDVRGVRKGPTRKGKKKRSSKQEFVSESRMTF